MIFIDSNIPMYIIGGEHPNKWKARESLEELIGRKQRLITDAEVYQEILHRYSAIHRNDAIPPAFALLDQIIDEVYPILMTDVRTAKDIMLTNPGLSARDTQLRQRFRRTRRDLPAEVKEISGAKKSLLGIRSSE